MEKRYLDSLPEPKDIQAVVLMGGLGSRLGERTKSCPKTLTEVGGTAFFDYQLKIMKAYGFRRFLFLVGYKGEMVERHYGDGGKYGVEISYSYDGGKALGTGGAVHKAYGLLQDDFLLIYGDSFMDIDYRETIYRYFCAKLSGHRALMTVMENRGRLDASNVVYEDGKIILYDKSVRTKRMRYIDYGVGMYDKTLFQTGNAQELPEEKEFDLAVLQNRLSIEGKLAAQEVTNRFYEIGTPASLEEFRLYAKQRFCQAGRAVFFDRDGVVNEIVFRDETEQLDSPLKEGEVKFMDGVAQAMRKLQEAGYYLFIVTNQPAAAKGKVRLADLYQVNTYICKRLAGEGVRIDGVEICPHYPGHPKEPEGNCGINAKKDGAKSGNEKFLLCVCQCRKPKTGMIDALARRFSIDREHSWMVGDSYTDILAGKGAGLKTAFLGNYKCDICKRLGEGKPDLLCGSVEDFANRILS